MALSVALLLSDIAEVKEISSVFRKLDIVPHYYEDLNSFWSGTLEKMPALCIVDVKNMSDGKLVLRDHPLVQTEEMPLIFYYSDKTEPLLFSTFDLFHLGTLKKTNNYEGPLKAILKRINKLMTLERNNLNLGIVKSSHQEQVENLQQQNEDLQKENKYRQMASSLISTLESTRGESDFSKAVDKVINSVEEFVEYSVLELNFNGQKLTSATSLSKKYKTIPSLWLGQTCANGIELFAQNMASQVATELMGGQLVSLMLRGQKAQPEKMIFIKSNDEIFFNTFDWNLFESYLSGLYASYQLKIKKSVNDENNLFDSFEALSFLDQFVFGKTIFDKNELNEKKTLDYRLVNVNLSSLLQVIARKGNQRFFWNKFHQEFTNKLELQSRARLKKFTYGVENLAFLVDVSELDYFFEELKEFSAKFHYWKYFETPESVMAFEIQPKVTMVPLSAYAYLQAVGVQQTTPQVPTKVITENRVNEIVWGRDSQNEI